MSTSQLFHVRYRAWHPQVLGCLSHLMFGHLPLHYFELICLVREGTGAWVCSWSLLVDRVCVWLELHLQPVEQAVEKGKGPCFTSVSHEGILTGLTNLMPCLVPVQHFPSPCQSIHYAWTTWPKTLQPHRWGLGTIGNLRPALHSFYPF